MSFFSLPPELRLQVYSYLAIPKFRHHTVDLSEPPKSHANDPVSTKDRTTTPPLDGETPALTVITPSLPGINILQTCHLVLNEARPILEARRESLRDVTLKIVIDSKSSFGDDGLIDMLDCLTRRELTIPPSLENIPHLRSFMLRASAWIPLEEATEGLAPTSSARTTIEVAVTDYSKNCLGRPLYSYEFPRFVERVYKLMRKPVERIGRIYLRKVGVLEAFGRLCRPGYPSDGLLPSHWSYHVNGHQYRKLCSPIGAGVPGAARALRLYLYALSSRGSFPTSGDLDHQSSYDGRRQAREIYGLLPGKAWAAKEPHWVGVKTAIEEAHLTEWMEGRLGVYTSEDEEGDDRPLW
jgi:hypothetical protein